MKEKIISAIEGFVFRFRFALILGFAALTLVMGWFATHTHVDAGFKKTLPLEHPYIQTFTEYETEFGGANRIVIALMARDGTIFTPQFFAALEQATDAVFFLPGVDRAQVQSLFTPNVRYVEVVDDGFAGGNVIPAGFSPTPENFEIVRENIIKSGKLGQLVANDFSGAIISAQLLEIDPATGEQLDYMEIAQALEEQVRDQFEGWALDVRFGVHIIGFAKVIGDISDGAQNVIFFFAIAFVITGILVLVYSQSLKLTAFTLGCAFVAVVWQLGVLNALGFGLDPYSILVPFLIFAIGVSHGVQMMRAYRAEAFSGKSSVDAARAAFRQLIVPGGVALLTDTLGFVTMLIIKIEVIRELAITSALGVAVIIITNLFLLPILLSYVNLPDHYRKKIGNRQTRTNAAWRKVGIVMHPVVSLAVIAGCIGLGWWAFAQSKEVRIGDIHAGVPELRQSSRYNEDNRVITDKFSIGVDILSVLAVGGPDACVDHDVVTLIDQFEGYMRNITGVQSIISLPSVAKTINAGWNEGSLKWRVLPSHPQALAQAVSPIETSTGLLNSDGSVMNIMIFLGDHRAETLTGVTDAVKKFAVENPSEKVKFRLATGNAGVMAATNEVVQAAQYPIVFWVFGAVITLCLVTFRSIRATICIVLPLLLVSYLGYALMVYLQIGLKTSTLPVVALGVGIGVDYGIYLFSRLSEALRRGDVFEDAMHAAFTQTGSAVVFTGLTLAIGVSTWIFSDLKFQADMGVLLTFMFLVNMIAAIVILPALARWLYANRTRPR